MTLPVFPDSSVLAGLAFSAKWSPTFFNQNSTSATGAEIDVALAPFPLHDFELTYQFLRDGAGWGSTLAGEEFRTMMGFHLMLGGSLGRFLYLNPDDYQVLQNEIAIGDGTTKTFLITRTFGANGYAALEPIGQINTGTTINVYLNGSPTPLSSSLYTISTANPCANTITFTTAPPLGEAIALDMQYYYYCKLANNANTFEKFMSRLWSLGKVQIRSCRPGT